MKIQINTDAHIDGSEALANHVRATIEQALQRFGEHVTRVEVHLHDENAGKSDRHDKRCLLEVRVQGRQPVAVTEHAGSMHQAINGAAQKMAHLLDSALGRLLDHREPPSDPLSSRSGPSQD